jgi:hypothetical protein
MKARDLEVNKHYLVIGCFNSSAIEEIVVLEKSKSAIKFSIVKQIGLDRQSWYLCDSFDSVYTVIDCLSEETNREEYWQIIDLVEIQKNSALSDSYNLGLYNGMEMCLALLQKREPKFEKIKKEEES